MLNLSKIGNLPLLVILAYLASGLDQWLFESTGFLPLYAQIAALVILVVHLTGKLMFGREPQPVTPWIVYALGLGIAFYLFWCVISFLYSNQSQIATDMLVSRTKSMLLLAGFSLAFIDRGIREGFAWVCVGLVVLATATNLQDMVNPTFSTVPGRAAGFYLNPNESGMIIVMLALVASTRMRPLPTYFLWGVTVIGATITFSRTAWVMLPISLFSLALLGKLGGGRGRFVFVGAVAFGLILLLTVYLSGDLYVWAVRSPLAYLLDPNTLGRLGSRGVALDDLSSLEREDVFKLALKTWLDSPFLGHGLGYTFEWIQRASTHNMVMLHAAEQGIIGTALYLFLVGLPLVASRGIVRVLMANYFLASMFSHNMFDMNSEVIILAFVMGSAAADTSSVATLSFNRPGRWRTPA